MSTQGGGEAGRTDCRVAMVGYAFMGGPTRRRGAPPPGSSTCRPRPGCAWSAAGQLRDRGGRPRLGWAEWSTDWREVVARDDVDVVDICTPGDTHAEIALAALEAGKHVLCEKPLANTVAEAEQMTRAAEEAARAASSPRSGSTTGGTPALALARELVADGAVGTVRHIRAHYLQDWIVDPGFPLVWRLQKDKAGSGALGDIGAHIVDLAQFLTGQRLVDVAGHLTRFVDRRPLPAESSGLSGSGDAARDRRGHRRRRRGVPRSHRRGCPRHLRGHPVRHRAARTACGSSSTARREVSPSTSRR